MKFIEVTELSKASEYAHYNPKKSLKNYLQEFMKMNIKTALVEFTELEYKSATAAYTCLRKACKRHAFPIDVRMINGKLYLVRKDV